MPTPDEEAELERTKMSFGQHLEELRGALIKAILAIVLGFIAGLLVGRKVVAYIQTPLIAALSDFYADLEAQREFDRLAKAGATIAGDPDDAAEEFAKEGLVPREYYIAPSEILEVWRQQYPDAADALPLPEDVAEGSSALPKRSEMLRLRVYAPLEDDERLKVVATGVEEPFLIFIKASLVVGILIASPFVFYFVWDFVASGLYKHERKYVYVFLPISLGLFLSGAALAFYVAIDFVLKFLLQFYSWLQIDPMLRVSEWMSFVLMLPLGFGISFQLPLVMLFLERMGIFTVETYESKWRVAVLVIAVISMFLTPADPGSMIVMATPLTVLYFLGIAMCRYFPASFSRPPEPNPRDGGAGAAGS